MGSLRRQPKKQTLPFRARDCQWPNMREGIPMKERLQSDRNFQWPNRAEAQLRKLSWDLHRRWTPLYGRIPMGHPPTAPCLKSPCCVSGSCSHRRNPSGENPPERGGGRDSWKAVPAVGRRSTTLLTRERSPRDEKAPVGPCASSGPVPWEADGAAVVALSQ